VERLIVDTRVLVAIERGRQIDKSLLADDADIALAAITASELLVGVELADEQRRPARTATARDPRHLRRQRRRRRPPPRRPLWPTYVERAARAAFTTSKSQPRRAQRAGC
jgi:predicted nucleic acid-binding protein